jgi:hypothetical protein
MNHPARRGKPKVAKELGIEPFCPLSIEARQDQTAKVWGMG